MQLVGAERRLGRLDDLALRPRPAATRARSSCRRSKATCRAPGRRGTRSPRHTEPETAPASWGSSNWGCTCSCDRHCTSTSRGPIRTGRRCRPRTRATSTGTFAAAPGRSRTSGRAAPLGGNVLKGLAELLQGSIDRTSIPNGGVVRVPGTPRAPARRCRWSRPRRFRCTHQVDRVRPRPARSCRTPASSARERFDRSIPSRSSVLTATSSASVESSPPETPRWSVVPAGSCSIRLASPAHWISKISAHRRFSSGPSAGTNGDAGTNRFRSSVVAGRWNGIRRNGASAGPAAIRSSGRAAVGLHLGGVDVLDDPVRVAADRPAVPHAGRLGQQAAVLGDQAVAAEDQVGGRLRRPAPRVGVGRDATARLADHQAGPVRALADRLVAGRQVEQDRRPGDRLERTRRDRQPEVLADLDAHRHPRPGVEQQIDPERDESPQQLDLGGAFDRPGAEPSALRRTPCSSAGAAWGRRPAPGRWRRPPRRCNRYGPTSSGRPTTTSRSLPSVASRHVHQAAQRGVDQRRLAEQVGAGVAGEAQLGKDDDVAVGRLLQHADDLTRVGLGIRHGGPDRGAGDAYKTEGIHAGNRLLGAVQGNVRRCRRKGT